MNNKVIQLSSYAIVLDDFFTAFPVWLNGQSYSAIIFLVDKNVFEGWQLSLEKLAGTTQAESIIFEAGEIHKKLSTCESIWEDLIQKKVDRKALLVNIGGGMTGDLGGFVAATYKRGIDFVQVPTTSLSMVDASIGGKVGINFSAIKNSIGVFCQPKAVFVDTAFLQSLSKREKISGLAEIIKHALIHDLGLWKDLQKLPSEPSASDWDHIIYRGIQVKQFFVEKDPFEKDIRKALNFGHTVGHALESYFLTTANPLLHGEAVALGMVAESYLSFLHKKLDREELDDIVSLIQHFFSFKEIKTPDGTMLLTLMENDKKNDGYINFSLIGPIGNHIINAAASQEDILESIAFCIKNFSGS